MKSSILTFAAVAGLVLGNRNAADNEHVHTLHYDVVVIGGGSAGTYSAIRLRDLGKKVAVVEAKSRMGGHTETYRDPATNVTIDIGVIDWHNSQFVKDYFSRFNVPLTLISFDAPGVITKNVDFATGKVDSAYAPANNSAAIGRYAAQLAKYPYLNGTLGKIPDKVPADFLIPFGDFIEKYELQDAVPFFSGYGQGFGNILNLPTLYALAYFSPGLLDDLQIGFLTTARNDNSELYEKAQAELGRDAFLNSRVMEMDRSNPKFVKVLVKTPTGQKIIKAKKIISTIPPILSNLHGFDLDREELSIFRQFKYHTYYAGILNNSGIPDNLSLSNVGTNTPYNLPVLPAVYGISPTRAPGQHLFHFGTPENQTVTDAQVEANIDASLDRLRAAGTLPDGPKPPTGYSIISSHTPYEVYVTPKQIAKGFYQKLFALQGRKNTYWTGAAFVTHDSTLIWKYTETLLPAIIS